MKGTMSTICHRSLTEVLTGDESFGNGTQFLCRLSQLMDGFPAASPMTGRRGPNHTLPCRHITPTISRGWSQGTRLGCLDLVPGSAGSYGVMGKGRIVN